VISFERRGGTNLLGECHFIFVEAEIFMQNAASTNTQIFLLLLYTNTTDRWKMYLPILLDPMHLPEEVPKVAWHQLWGGPCRRHLAAFPPANTSSPAQNPKH